MADQPGSTERNWIAAQSSTVALAPVRLPDGRTALASAGAGGVLLHELDGQLVRDLSQGTDATWLGGTVSSGLGGQLLVLGDHKGAIHLVDPGTGRTVRRLAGHRGGVEVATVGTLGDGRAALVTAGKDLVIRVWDPATGARVHRLYGHKATIHALAVVDQGDGLPNWLASADQNGRILIWNLATGQQLRQIRAPMAVHALAFWRLSNVDLVLAWSVGHTVRLWDVLRNKQVRQLSGHDSRIRALTLVPAGDGPLLASGSMDRTIRLWDSTTGDLLGELDGHERGVWSLAVLRDPDGRVLLASGSDAVRVWDPLTGERVHEYVGHTNFVMALAPVLVPGRGRVLASTASGGSLRLWDPEDGQEITDGVPFSYGHVLAPFDLRWPGLACASYSDEVDLLSLGPEPNRELTWTRRIPLPTWVRLLRRRPSTGVELNAMVEVAVDDRKLLAAAGQDGTIRIWDLATGARLRQIAAHDGSVNALAALSTPEGETFLGSAGQDGFIRFWEPVPGRREGHLDAHQEAIYALQLVTLPGGGQLLASAGADTTVRLWDLADSRLHRELIGHIDYVRALAAVPLPSGRPLLASAGDDHMVRLWDPATGQEIRQLVGHTDWVRALAAVQLAGGQYRLASAGDDGRLRLWNPATGALITRFGGASDRPARQDLIGREALVAALAAALRPRRHLGATDESADGAGPTVVTVEGRWGSGKTSLMRQARDRLAEFHAWPVRPRPPTGWRRWLDWRPLRSVVAPWRGQLRVVTADRALARGRLPSPPVPARGPAVLTAWFNPWSHQSSDQVWAGLADAILTAAKPVLFPDDEGGAVAGDPPAGARRDGYWFGRNLRRVDRRAVQGTLRRRLASPLLKTGVLALLVPLVTRLTEPTYRFEVAGLRMHGVTLALLLPAALIGLGLVHSLWRYLCGAATDFLPAELFRGPILSGSLRSATTAPPESGRAGRDRHPVAGPATPAARHCGRTARAAAARRVHMRRRGLGTGGGEARPRPARAGHRRPAPAGPARRARRPGRRRPGGEAAVKGRLRPASGR